jgi:5-methylcytosine-specific restriction endonuclease McrA
VRKLAAPLHVPVEVYDTCVAAVNNMAVRAVYIHNRNQIAGLVDRFNAHTISVSWASLPRVRRGRDNTIIAGGLTKQHFKELYTTYMVSANGDSRKIYDSILVAAGGLCPYCGGLGHVNTLDHYLPKSIFPAYSVLPANLVPSCRDCNSGKGAAFALLDTSQTLHPYLDDGRFFDQRWIVASVRQTNPIEVEFTCRPPAAWSDLDKSRVEAHFDSFNLRYRFRIAAAAEVTRLIDLRSGFLSALPPNDFKDYLIECANSTGFDLNGWSRTTFEALAETDWFLNADFNDPTWHLV